MMPTVSMEITKKMSKKNTGKTTNNEEAVCSPERNLLQERLTGTFNDSEIPLTATKPKEMQYVVD